MALEKQARSDRLELLVDWPERPKETTVAGKQVILAEDFYSWLQQTTLAIQQTMNQTASEIEKLKSAAK